MPAVRMFFFRKMIGVMNGVEDRATARPGLVAPDEDSPERFDIIGRKMQLETPAPNSIVPMVIPAMLTVMRSMSSLDDNPLEPRTEITPDELAELEAEILALGASSVGYTTLPARHVFRDKGVLSPHAIVLSMAMDKQDMLQAPSLPTLKAVWRTYRDLGFVSQKVAVSLRRRGFAAYGGHPLNGLALYPPLAQAAGLGWLGYNGLIVTPEHGPCVRLAAVFTSIENLPTDRPGADHSWVEAFCDHCRACIAKCPADAIHDAPVKRDNGRIHCIDSDRCFPEFNDRDGCSVCIAVCPFTKKPYESLRAIHLRHSTEDED
jgi:epoxyqueuosine reductase